MESHALDTTELIDTIVMGTLYEKDEIMKFVLGDLLWLRREPHSPHDKNTIRVENQKGKLLGYIMQELAVFVARYMDFSKHDIQAKVTELSMNSSGQSVRLKICFYLPSYWLRNNSYEEFLDSQNIDYYYWEDHIRANIKVFINSSERVYNKIKTVLSINNFKFKQFSGLSHRHPLEKAPYQWCIQFSNSVGISEAKIKRFFQKNFNIIPIQDRIKAIEDEKSVLESERSFFKEELAVYEKLADQITAEQKGQIQYLNIQNAQLQNEISNKEKEIQNIQYRLESLKNLWEDNTPVKNDNLIEVEYLFDIFQKHISDRLTPYDSLKMISALFSEHIIVLDSAFKSAKRSERFHQKNEVFELLWKLATDHWDILAYGKGDVAVKNIYGERYSAKEAETVEKNPRLRKLRTFNFGEKRKIEMMKHLKIGVADNVEHTIRIHFEWLAQEKKIIIGYCGPHLPLK